MQKTLMVNGRVCKTILINGLWNVIIDGIFEKLYYGWGKNKNCIDGKSKVLKLKYICNCCGKECFGNLYALRKSCSHSYNNKISRFKFLSAVGDRRLKVKAQNYINHLITAGKIERPKVCSNCGRQGMIEAHHPNYDKPNEVIWWCRYCHMKLHHGHKDIKGKLIVYSI